jgi:uncharacterized protein with GYD domain
MTMGKFVIRFIYSSASWARMLNVTDDQVATMTALLEHFGGHLESMYWEVETASSYVTADLPDSASAAAAILVTTKTGAFREVRVHEVLTQEQLRDVVALARSAEGVYRPPGQAAVETDDI